MEKYSNIALWIFTYLNGIFDNVSDLDMAEVLGHNSIIIIIDLTRQKTVSIENFMKLRSTKVSW